MGNGNKTLLLGAVLSSINYPGGVALVKLRSDGQGPDFTLEVLGEGLQDFFEPGKAYAIEIGEVLASERAQPTIEPDPAEDTALETAAVAAAVVDGPTAEASPDGAFEASVEAGSGQEP